MENRRLAPRRGVQVRDYERLQFFFIEFLPFIAATERNSNIFWIFNYNYKKNELLKERTNA